MVGHPTPGCTSGKLNFRRHVHPNIQCSTAYNTAGDGKPPQCPSLAGNDVAHVHSGTLFGHRKGEAKDSEAWCAEVHRRHEVGHDRAGGTIRKDEMMPLADVWTNSHDHTE